MSENTDKNNRIEKAALDILSLARSLLIVRLRFLDIALSMLRFAPDDSATLATDGVRLIYGPEHVIAGFRSGREKPVRDYLHVVLHCVYSHMFTGDLAERELWDLACDIAVESTINDLGLDVTASAKETEQRAEADMIREKVGMLTAEKIYHCLLAEDLSGDALARLRELFKADDHAGWHRRVSAGKEEGGSDSPAGGDEQTELPDGEAMPYSPFGEPEEEWKDIAEKLQEALETFFRDQGDEAGDLVQNLKELNREKYDYTEFLKKFAVPGEAVGVNDEEFDYIFYTYGLELYGDMPLVEPLEYREVRRIREFVIAIDTSASTSGELVQRFLQKTYNILKSTESYFSRVNIHIIQCDAEIREHVKISSEKDFDAYISSMEIHGLGGTDFRPVFEFVDSLAEAGEFTDLRGLIYFTDGFGYYPSRKPKYETAFVFLDNDYNYPDVPPWAIRLVLQDEDIEE